MILFCKKNLTFCAIVFTIIFLSSLNCISGEEIKSLKTSSQQTESLYLHPFSMLWSNMGDTFSGLNLIYTGSGIIAALLMVQTEMDNKIRNYFEPYPWFGRPYTRFMLRAGDIYGLALSSTVYFTGLIAENSFHTSAGAAALQALGVSSAIIGAIKLSTGRSIPWKPNMADDFHFFDYYNNVSEKNVYFPSGHTGTTLTVGAALSAFYHENKWLPWVVYPVSALMGFAMMEGSFHWGSDVIAGALISFAIGFTTGKNFRKEYDERLLNSQIMKKKDAENSKYNELRMANRTAKVFMKENIFSMVKISMANPFLSSQDFTKKKIFEFEQNNLGISIAFENQF